MTVVESSERGAATPLAPRSRRVKEIPRDDDGCGWSASLPELPPPSRLQGSHEADCAVIGAGFTGLAIARRLAELKPGWRVVVVDAQRVAEGTSGRSSGFVCDLIDVATRMAPAQAKGYVALARSGIEQLKSLIQQHGIDCEWDETGWIRAAASEVGAQALAPWPRWFEEHGMEYVHLDGERMAQITGSRFYRCGIRIPGTPLVHGAALVRGLAASLPAGVELFEDSPVTGIEPRRDAYRLALSEGGIEARKLFLATNGYTPFLRFLPLRLFPLYTFGSFTRVLSEAEQQRLGGEREWGLLAMDPMGSSVRRVHEQRILIRNTVHYSRRLRLEGALLERMRRHHRTAFDARFPSLAEVPFEHTWAGLMGTSYNSQLSFGTLRRNLYVSAGYTGAGIAMGTVAGRLLAEMAAGESSDLLEQILGLPRPTVMPPEPFRSLGGQFLSRRMNGRAGAYL